MMIPRKRRKKFYSPKHTQQFHQNQSCTRTIDFFQLGSKLNQSLSTRQTEWGRAKAQIKRWGEQHKIVMDKRRQKQKSITMRFKKKECINFTRQAVSTLSRLKIIFIECEIKGHLEPRANYSAIKCDTVRNIVG